MECDEGDFSGSVGIADANAVNTATTAAALRRRPRQQPKQGTQRSRIHSTIPPISRQPLASGLETLTFRRRETLASTRFEASIFKRPTPRTHHLRRRHRSTFLSLGKETRSLLTTHHNRHNHPICRKPMRRMSRIVRLLLPSWRLRLASQAAPSPPVGLDGPARPRQLLWS